MRSAQFRSLVLATASLVLISTFIPAHSAGRTNQSVANTILNGRGAPTAKIGINGDFYIDTNTMNIYGPKTKNLWPKPVSLRGPSGVDGKSGNDGRDGNNGSSISGAEGARGPKGDTGPQGLKGDKGDKGDPGERGANGAQGSAGLVGATGPAGPKGETGAAGIAGAKGDKGDAGLIGATGATGATGPAGTAGLVGAKGDKGDKGDTGLTGTTGNQGPKGDPGETGATGATGATGPSSAVSGVITFQSALQGTAGATQPSQIFGDLQAGKSYVFDIFIWGIDESEGTALTLAIETVGVSLTLKPHWIISRSESYRDNVLKTERAFIAKVAINGSSTSSNYNLRVNVSTAYPIGASAAIALFGGFTSQLVGSVTVIPTT